MEGKNKLKVFIVEQRGGGGMIHYAYQLCNAMAKEEAVDVTLITSTHYELENLPHNFKVNKLLKLWKLIDPSISVIPRNMLEKLWRKVFWNVRRVFRGVQVIFQWYRLTKHLIKIRPDVVQVGSLETTVEILFLLFWHRKGIRITQICHEFEERDASNNLIIKLDNQISYYLYQAFSAIFLHGEVNKSKFLSIYDIPSQKVHSIEHGNEQIFQKPENATLLYKSLREKYKLREENLVALFFGNLTPSKGIPDLIQAFEHVYKRNKNARLIVTGMASKYIDIDDFINFAKKLGLDEAIVFDSRYIPMEEIEPLMNLANVVVLPYRTISQSGVLQVAYAFGKPVVATNTGGFPEAVEEGKSGFLVPVEAPKELSEAILKILENPILAKEMGSYAKHLSETRFAWEPIAKKILGVYFNLVEKTKS